jgi:hypothetical protein
MAGVQISVTLTRRQAAAVLAAELSAGYGVRRSAALVEAERRLKDAVRQALDNDPAPRQMQTEPGA